MKYALLILTTLVGITLCAQETHKINEKHVLFIGNSLTYFNSMPQMLQKMLDETHPEIRIDQSTFPGMSLNGHLSEIITSSTENEINTRKKNDDEQTETEKKLLERKWDIIVLQTGTVGVLIPENREFKIKRAISDIKNIVTNPECQFIVFNTWPSKDSYPKKYCYPGSMIDKTLQNPEYCSPLMENLRQEVTAINNSYKILAKENKLIQSDNGTKFFEVITKYPEIELYDDDTHPSQYGSFLNACIFYKMLTGKEASELIYIGSVAADQAKILKSVADE